MLETVRECQEDSEAAGTLSERERKQKLRRSSDLEGGKQRSEKKKDRMERRWKKKRRSVLTTPSTLERE